MTERLTRSEGGGVRGAMGEVLTCVSAPARSELGQGAPSRRVPPRPRTPAVQGPVVRSPVVQSVNMAPVFGHSGGLSAINRGPKLARTA